MEVDDKTLTLFLIDCMTQIADRSIKAVKNELVPGTISRGLKQGDLRYLEIISGRTELSRVEVLVYNGAASGPIFGMNIVSQLEMSEIIKHSLNYSDVQLHLQKARQNGFNRTREKIRVNKKGFSLFDIPPFREPVPVQKGGLPGSLSYDETIDDQLEFFGGGEEIHFHPDATGRPKVRVFRSQIQGCRF